MITKEKVDRLITTGLLKIEYTYVRNHQGDVTLLSDGIVDPSKPDSIAYKTFYENFKGDRLNLTCGSIIYSHKYSKLRGRVNFLDKPNYFDLAKTNNEILILPGEIISVPTNERIGLNFDPRKNETANRYLGALILPRLSLADAGLFYVPSYIDPTWDGILQATIYNMADKPIKLSIGEQISVCKFYEMDGQPDAFFLSSFKEKNHHYGINWRSVLDGSIEPVRRGKQTDRHKNIFQRINSKAVKQLLFENFPLIIGGGLLVNLITFYWGVKVAFVDYPKTKETIEVLTLQVNKLPITGTHSLVLQPGKRNFDGNFLVDLDGKKLDGLWFDYNKEDVQLSNLQLIKDPQPDGKLSRYLYTIVLPKPVTKPTILKIKYIICE